MIGRDCSYRTAWRVVGDVGGDLALDREERPDHRQRLACPIRLGGECLVKIPPGVREAAPSTIVLPG